MLRRIFNVALQHECCITFLTMHYTINNAFYHSADTLTENYTGEKIRNDLCLDNLDKADKVGDSYGCLNQQANSNPVNGASLNPLLKIKNLRQSNVNRVIVVNLKINSLTNKFDQLKKTVLKYIDIIVITETRLDAFPNAQFLVPGFSKPFCIDKNRKRGRVMTYVGENIPRKPLRKHVLPSDIECVFLELHFKKCKWLLVRTYIYLHKMIIIFLRTYAKRLMNIVAMKRFYL